MLAVLCSASTTKQSLLFSPSSAKFGSVVVGQSETQLVTLTNTSQTSVTIAAISVSNSQFSVSGLTLPVVVTAAGSVSLNVTFAPTQNGWTGATITFTNNSSQPNLRLSVAGGGVKSGSLTAAPANLSFGQVAVGASTTLPLVLTNVDQWKITLNAAQATGIGFSVNGPAFPIVLNGGQSISLSVVFAPQAQGLSGGSLLISGPNLTIPLTGSGTTVGQLSISPLALNFGSVDVGSTATLAGSLTATGGSVTVSSAASNSGQFVIAGASFPLTINAGQSVPFSVVFAPTTTGTASGALNFTSNASQGTESLSGTGISPQYTVNLSWNGSTSPVVGYNVYRGTAVGSYSKINTAIDATTAYSDNTVAPGVTYYYCATAVSSTGEESTYSAPIEVAVP